MNLKGWLAYLLRVYCFGMLVFFCFRVLNILANPSLFQTVPSELRLGIYLKSFFTGFRFDTVISVYLLLLPFTLLVISEFVKKSRFLISIINLLIALLYCVTFIIAAIDVPYFSHFNYKITIAAFQWMEDPLFVVKMIAAEWRYMWIILPFGLLFYLQIRLLKSFKEKLLQNSGVGKWQLKIVPMLLVGFLLFTGLRGRLNFSKAPLGTVDAYFSNYSFANQLSMSPVFSFLKSYLNANKKGNENLNLMPSDEALALVKKELRREGDIQNPIAKKVEYKAQWEEKPNVVLLLMEGMSTARMERFGNQQKLTPFLDSIAKLSMLFTNIYSSGIHTHNGIYSTFTSYPSLYEKNAMYQTPIPHYNTLARVMQQHNYSTTYFTNHDVEFDNVGGFLTENGVEQLISERQYPEEEILSTLGVSDHFMFQYSLPILDSLAGDEKPFFTTFMTTSNHGPYRIPDYFERKHNNDELDACSFADWSLNKFFAAVNQKDWFDNTIFVLLADHGWSINSIYDMSLSYTHIPFMVYSPKYFEPQELENLGGQIDVFPTLMHLLQYSYVNNSLGINLLEEERPFIYFNGDNKIGVLDSADFLIVRKDAPNSMHKYKFKSTANILDENQAKAKRMKRYAFANMQVANDMVLKNMVVVRD